MALTLFHSRPVHFHSRPVQQRQYIRTLEQKQRDSTYPARRQQLLDDAADVAYAIFTTLGIKNALLFNDLWQLCKEHGCEPLVCMDTPREKWGLFDGWDDITDFSDGGQIVLSANLTFAESCAVMAHELAHRVLYTPRFTDFLEGERAHQHYDPHDWQEAVARAVERLFLEAGGTGLLPPRY